MAKSAWHCLTFIVAAAAVGCGQRAPGPALAPVSGTVKLHGQPIAGALLHFVPTGDTLGAGGSGRTDAKGEYKLTYLQGGSGVVPGNYKVVIKRPLKADGGPAVEGAAVGAQDADARESLPGKYSDPEETQLTAVVPAEGGPVDFNLLVQEP